MTPIDPVEKTRSNPRPPMAPPYVDEDVNEALVENGLDVAENERRETMADTYEANAAQSDESGEELDDIDYSAGDGGSVPPEISAMHEEYIPLADDDETEE